MLLKLTYCKGMWSMVGGLESRGAWTEVEAAERGAEGKWLPCWLRRGLTPNPCRPKGDPCTFSHHPGVRQLLQI